MIDISRFSFQNPRFKALLGRQSSLPEEVLRTAEQIIADIRERGDDALFELMLRYDGIDLSETGPRVTEEEFEEARSGVDDAYAQALQEACQNLFQFHSHQLPRSYGVGFPHDVLLERRYRPLERVGVCVPAGSAPLSSSLYMNVVPALVAGVPEIHVASAPRNGRIDPAILYAADYLGVRRVYKISGAQAVAALALGTDSVPMMDKIVGPGNAYVQAAKKLLFGTVGIDSIAGPSELAVITDDTAPPEFVAADLLSQAEHGTGYEASVAFCLSQEEAESIRDRMSELVSSRNLEESVAEAIERFGNLFVVDSVMTAVDAVNLLAPEHCEVMTADADEIAGKITNAGAVFIGAHCPEPVGDYFCGTNHVLPTGGTARFSSGLSVQDFLRGYSVVRYTDRALRANGNKIRALARAEGMTAHMLSIEARENQARDDANDQDV